MPSPVPYSGKNSIFSVNGTTVHSMGWNVNNTIKDDDVTNTSQAGYTDQIECSRSLVATVEAQWDSSANPLDNPPSLYAGSILTNVKLYQDGTSSPFWGMASALVTETPHESKVGSVSKITFTIKNKGPFTRPTGTFTPSVTT